MASVGLQGITHWYLILNLKNEYGKKYIQSAVFYVNGNKEKNDIVRIIGRVTINGIVTQFSYK